MDGDIANKPSAILPCEYEVYVFLVSGTTATPRNARDVPSFGVEKNMLSRASPLLPVICGEGVPLLSPARESRPYAPTTSQSSSSVNTPVLTLASITITEVMVVREGNRFKEVSNSFEKTISTFS